jgi:chromosome segregation ATPase
MTFLGKILAVVNLVLSVGVGALIVQNYVSRANWHKSYEEAVAQASAAVANARVKDAEIKDVQGKILKKDEEIAAKAKEMASKEQEFAARIKTEAEKLEKRNAEAKESAASSGAAAGELDRLHKEVGFLKGLVAQRDSQLKDMEKKVEDNRSTRVEAEINARSEQERNNNLLTELEKLTKENQRLQQQGGAGAVAQIVPGNNPPAEDVEGSIQRVDVSSGLVTISIGSDAGVNKGNTLEVFRLKPEPKYLGTIQVLAVQPDKAVGKPLNRTSQIQVGDRVASKILSKR